jgi:hypothetical protein
MDRTLRRRNDFVRIRLLIDDAAAAHRYGEFLGLPVVLA